MNSVTLPKSFLFLQPQVIYQRSSILSWLSHRQVCPITGSLTGSNDVNSLSQWLNGLNFLG